MLNFIYFFTLNESTNNFVKLINNILAKIANFVMPIVYKLFNKKNGIENDNNIIISLTSYPNRIKKYG